jgi:sugar phosphate permease
MNFAQLLDSLPVVTAFAGCVFGLIYFAVLRHTLVMLTGRHSRRVVMALTLLRLGAATAFFLLVATLGAFALLAALVGFLSARTLALRAESRSG